MIYQTFSPKQIQAMLWWAMPKFRQYDAIICDGSVRSGKTMAMSIGYLLWSMRSFDHETFAFCGKTIDSLKRNVVMPIQKWMAGVMQPKINLSKNYMDVEWQGHHNRYYFFGGKDESSYALIQGITLAGVLLDEVALMPRSFVDQATARCSVTGSKIWMNCNPDGSEEHWLYKEWIDSVHGKAGEKNRLHLHFTMDDNPSLAERIKERYRNMYTGVFYKRYILGLWVMAEGLIYDMFDPEKHVVDPKDIPAIHPASYYVSCDYGTQNATAFHLWGQGMDGIWYCIREYYYSGRDAAEQKTNTEYANDLEKWLDGIKPQKIVVDPSAASFIAELKKRGYSVKKAKNDVLDGIRFLASLLMNCSIKFSSDCTMTLKEFASYVWDAKASEKGEDKPLKVFDHAMDSIRYFVYTIIRKPSGLSVMK